MEQGEQIAVYGDYDCDGITATAMLYSYLEDLGARVIYYIPDRDVEGYGLNRAALDFLKEQQVERRGVLLENFAMELALEGGEGHGSH